MKKYLFLIPSNIILMAWLSTWVTQKYNLSNEIGMSLTALYCLLSFGLILGLIAFKNKIKKMYKKKTDPPHPMRNPDFESRPGIQLPSGRLFYLDSLYEPEKKTGLQIPKPKPWTKPQPIINSGVLSESENKPIPLYEDEVMCRMGDQLWIYNSKTGVMNKTYQIIP